MWNWNLNPGTKKEDSAAENQKPRLLWDDILWLVTSLPLEQKESPPRKHRTKAASCQTSSEGYN